MSPIVTGSSAPPGLARSCSTIAADRSMPVTGPPRAARHPGGRERQPDAPSADRQFERGPAVCERLEPIEGRGERLGGEHGGAVVVVAGGDLRTEMVLMHRLVSVPLAILRERV